jgi:hypothetical protein
MATPDERYAAILALELLNKTAWYKKDPAFLRLLAMASESASTFDTFITT